MLRSRLVINPGKVRFVDACPTGNNLYYFTFNSVEREWRVEMEMGDGDGWVGGWVALTYRPLLWLGCQDLLQQLLLLAVLPIVAGTSFPQLVGHPQYWRSEDMFDLLTKKGTLVFLNFSKEEFQSSEDAKCPRLCMRQAHFLHVVRGKMLFVFP